MYNKEEVEEEETEDEEYEPDTLMTKEAPLRGWICPECDGGEFVYVVRGYSRLIPLKVIEPEDGSIPTYAEIVYEETRFEADEDGSKYDDDWLYVRCAECDHEWNLTEWYPRITRSGNQIVLEDTDA